MSLLVLLVILPCWILVASVSASPSPCDYVPETGMCAKAMTMKFFYNKFKGRCDVFMHSCSSTLNRFDTLEECYQECICPYKKPRPLSFYCTHMPALFRYYYDSRKKACIKTSNTLRYCRLGNAFEHLSDCLDTCDCGMEGKPPCKATPPWIYCVTKPCVNMGIMVIPEDRR